MAISGSMVLTTKRESQESQKHLQSHKQNTMKLVTISKINLNSGVSSPEKAIIEGELIEDFGKIQDGCRSFFYIYSFVDGVVFKQGTFTTTKEEANTTFDIIKGNLPDIMNTDHSEFELIKKYEGFRVEMSKHLSTPIENIKIIN